MKQPGFRTAVFICSLALNTQVFSQVDDSLTTYQHNEPIVVSATRTEQKASDVSRSLSVITKEEINNGIYISPLDILSQKEGMSFIGGGQTPGSAQTIFMRGVNSNSTAILIDGVRISDPSSIDNSLNFSEMSLSNISQIEVIRGAHSTLYGSSAIGGVINFITEKNRTMGLNADFSTQVGTFGESTSLFNQDLFLNYTFANGLYFNSEVFNYQIAGIDATVDNLPDSVYKTTDRDDFSKLETSVKAGFVNDDLDAFIFYKHMDQKADIDDGAFADDDNRFVKSKGDLLTYNFKYKFNANIVAAFNGGYSNMLRTSTDDSSIVSYTGTYDHSYSFFEYTGELYTNELQFSYSKDNMNMLFGFSSNHENMNSLINSYSQYFGFYTDENRNFNTTTYSVFNHFDFNGSILSENLKYLNMAFGGRVFNHSVFKNAFTFDINPSCKMDNTLIYGSVSSGYNTPSLYRLYTPFIGNKDLKPEKSLSLELGLRQSINKDYSFYISIFQNEISNIHEYVYLWDGSKSIDSLTALDNFGDTYINAGTMTTKGFEFGFKSIFFDQLIISGNASWLAGEQNYSPEDINSDHTNNNHVQVFNNGNFITGDINVEGLTRRSNTVNISILYTPSSKISVGSNIRYTGKRDDVIEDYTLGPWGAQGRKAVNAYTLVDLNGRYHLINPLQLTLRIENVLDKKYSEILGYNTRGRGFYMGLKYTL